MKLIGLSGKARVGKSTAASFLTEHGWTEISLADPIKRGCLEFFSGKMTERHLWGDGRDELIAELGGLTARRALQSLGTEWGRGCYPDIWIKKCLDDVQRLAGNDSDARHYTPERGVHRQDFKNSIVPWFVIPDVRFKNEAAAIRKAGGEVWRIERPGVRLEGEAAAHSSENELRDIGGRTRRLFLFMDLPTYDYNGVICNDGDLAKLQRAVASAFMLEGA